MANAANKETVSVLKSSLTASPFEITKQGFSNDAKKTVKIGLTQSIISAGIQSPKSPLTEEQKARLLSGFSLKNLERSTVRWLTLSYGKNLDGCMFHLRKSWKLRFIIGQTFAGAKIRLFTNHPLESGARRNYRELQSKGRADIPEMLYADVDLISAGSYSFYFTVDGSSEERNSVGFGRYIVDPDLRVGRSLKRVPVDGIVCQTVLSKNLGPFSGWMSRLMVAKMSGYNAIHFTPLQELGDSHSAYALRDMLKLNPCFGPGVALHDIASLVDRLNKDFEILSFTDLVLNHAANESEWIASHPDCVYNLVNAPHLRPAFLLDRALARFSRQIESGKWAQAGIPANIHLESHLEAVKKHLFDNVIPELRLWEFFQLNVEDIISKVQEWVESSGTIDVGSPLTELRIVLNKDLKFERFGAAVDLNLASRLYGRFGDRSYNDLRQVLHKLNYESGCKTHDHVISAVTNIITQARQRFVDPLGLKMGAVTSDDPLVNCYFRPPVDYVGQCSADDEALMDSKQAKYCWVHSGWVDSTLYDPLRNFAELGSDVYLRRELNSWTDSVKLRYGSRREDAPDLWDRVQDYAKVTARIFHGIRLDNCHSTSLAVVEHVLAAARSVRPDLYVFAELFTGSSEQTMRHASHLGLNAVIQGALDVSESRQLAQQLKVAGGRPLGSFALRTVDPLVSSQLPVIFFDQTHDDPSPLDRRSVDDLLPLSALVAASSAAIGSNRGYDEVVPRRISVIDETRIYRAWEPPEVGRMSSSNASASGKVSSSTNSQEKVYVNFDTGIIRAKKALNELHISMATDGYEQIGVELLGDDVVAITRYSSTRRRACVVVVHSAVPQTGGNVRPIRQLQVPGLVDSIVLEASVDCRSFQCRQHPELIVGLPNLFLHIQKNIDRADSSSVNIRPTDVGSDVGSDIVEFKNFKPGCVLVLDVVLSPVAEAACASLDELVKCFDQLVWNVPPQLTELTALKQASAERLEMIIAEPNLKARLGLDSSRNCVGGFECVAAPKTSELSATETKAFIALLNVVSQLSSDDARCVLYGRADEKCAAYHLPGHGDLNCTGLAGLTAVFEQIKHGDADPLSHPLGQNLCRGTWLMDYVTNRLASKGSTASLADWLCEKFNSVKKLPHFLIPRYFEAIVTGVFSVVSMQV